MINARFMYLRPGNLFKDFVVESNTQIVTASGRVVNDPERRRLKDHQRMSCRVHEGTEGISFNERPCLHPYDCAGGKSGSKEVR